MLGDPTQLSFITLFFGVVIFILVMFLPASLELSRPKDAGPRRIDENIVPGKYRVQLASMEKAGGAEADLVLKKKIASILSALPNLET